jgi:hypothetical protein
MECVIFILSVINLKYSPDFKLMEKILKILFMARLSRFLWMLDCLNELKNLLKIFFNSIRESRWVLLFISIMII